MAHTGTNMCVMLSLLIAALHHSQLSTAQQPPISKSFGNGVPGFPICTAPVTLVNYTLSTSATHGVLHHFWETSADDVLVEYFLDGETTPSISFQPSHMCGLPFEFLGK